MASRTLQIAVLGENEDAVFVGLSNFPAQKLTLITLNDAAERGEKVAGRVFDKLTLPVEIIKIKDETIPTVLEAMTRIIRKEAKDFQDVLINVGSADKNMVSAVITAAFANGIKAFDVADGKAVKLPVLELSYGEIISGVKLEILHAIQKTGGEVGSLQELAKASGFGKPLLSYHIRGVKEAKGLLALGLVEVERQKQGRLKVKLTGLAHLILSMPRMEAVS